MSKEKSFTGHEPIEVLRWLTSYFRACRQENLPEDIALKLESAWLTGSALTQWELYYDSTDIGGFCSWPGAVNHLLRTYCPDQILDIAYAAVQTMRQEPNEPVREYHNRLTKAAGKLPGMFDQRYLMPTFDVAYAKIFPAGRRP